MDWRGLARDEKDNNGKNGKNARRTIDNDPSCLFGVDWPLIGAPRENLSEAMAWIGLNKQELQEWLKMARKGSLP